MTTKTKLPLRFLVYRWISDDWYFALHDSNDKVLADSSEGYKSRADAIRMVREIIAGAANAMVDVEEEE